ncbi:MAG: transcriptional regulator FtrA [Acidobacteriota bacterium]
MAARSLLVVALTHDRASALELGIVTEVFGLQRPEIDPWYRFELRSMDPGPLQATGGLGLVVDDDLSILSQADLVIVPGWRGPEDAVPEPVIAALQRAHRRGCRLVSICSGAFVLAATGVLAGRRATTHWLYAPILERLYPEIEVDPDVLYVDEGQILTSAGSAAGFDLCLHLVRQDYGAAVANRVARRLVVAPHREGGQAQFIERPLAGDGSGDLAPTLDWLRDRLAEPHTAESVAAGLHISARTLARRFRSHLGTTLHRWLTGERVLHAQSLLETTADDLETIAQRSGFSDARLLRLHFRRTLGISPSAYRKRFAAGDGVEKAAVSLR